MSDKYSTNLILPPNINSVANELFITGTTPNIPNLTMISDKNEDGTSPSDYSIGEKCFQGRTSIKSINLYNCKEIKANAFSIVGDPGGNLSQVVIPSVQTIGSQAFARQKILENITANNCTSLSSDAFVNCKALKTASFTKLQSCSGSSFNGTNLESIKLGSVNVSNLPVKYENNFLTGTPILNGSNISNYKIMIPAANASKDPNSAD
jgi:hypothetical protein